MTNRLFCPIKSLSPKRIIKIVNIGESEEKIFLDTKTLQDKYRDKELKAFIMQGDSMSPLLEHGDIAIYIPIDKPKFDGNYIINTPHHLTARRLKIALNGTIRLSAINQIYNFNGDYDEEFQLDELDTLEVLGYIVTIVKKSL